LGKSKAKGRVKSEDIIAPPAEQMAGGAFAVEDVTDKRRGGGTITIGKAYRRLPMIDVLFAANVLSIGEYKALRHYRHHADIADRSPVRDSLCLQRGDGYGASPTVTTLNAVRLVSDVEAAVGSLLDVLRAVVVYDRSLSQVAIDRAGAIEQSRDRKGRRVTSLEPPRKALEIVKLEIRMAAKRVEAELAA
jgi:hypothetical protein